MKIVQFVRCCCIISAGFSGSVLLLKVDLLAVVHVLKKVNIRIHSRLYTAASCFTNCNVP